MANQTATITEFINYSSEYEVLICSLCQFCINPAQVNRHLLRYHHSLSRPDRVNIMNIIDECQLVLAIPNSVKAPDHLECYFDQLKLTAPEYFACHLCHKGVTKHEPWLREHYNKIHRITFTHRANPNPYWSGLEAQSFFNAPNQRLFIADTAHNRAQMADQPASHANPSPAASTAEAPDWQMLINNTLQAYQEVQTTNARRTQEAFSQSDERLIHQFILNFRWNLWLEGKDLHSLTALALRPEKGDRIGAYIHKAVNECWFAIDRKLPDLDRSILQIVNTHQLGLTGSQYAQRPFKSLQTHAVKNRYATLWKEFIYMLFRIWKNAYYDGTFAEFDARLVDALRCIEEIGLEADWKMKEEDLPLIAAQIYRLLDTLLRQDLRQRFSHHQPKFTSPLIIFCIIKSFTHSTGAFRAEDDLSGVFGGIIYSIKLWFLGHSLHTEAGHLEANPNSDAVTAANPSAVTTSNPSAVTASNPSAFTASNPNAVTTSDPDAFTIHGYVESYHKKYLTVDQFTVYAEIQHYRAYARRMNARRIRGHHIEEVNDDLIRFDGEDIRISEWKRLFHHLINECEALLYNQLLFIHPNELSAQINLDALHDDIHERSHDWWFQNWHANRLDAYNTFLIHRLIDPTTALGKSFGRRGASGIELEPIKTQEWLRTRMEFLKTLALAIHLTSGSPVRGSEILMVIYKNSSMFMRDIYIDNNTKLVRMLTRYGKMRATTGQECPTVRFVNRRLSRLIIHYLVIALPFSNHLNIIRWARDGRNYPISGLLFEDGGERLSDVAFAQFLRLQFQKHLHASLGLLGIRHSLKYIIKTRILVKSRIYLSDSESGSDSDSDDLVEDRMANHSTRTAQQVYSRNQFIPIAVTEHAYTNYLALCRKVHRFWQLDEEELGLGLSASAQSDDDSLQKSKIHPSASDDHSLPAANLPLSSPGNHSPQAANLPLSSSGNHSPQAANLPSSSSNKHFRQPSSIGQSAEMHRQADVKRIKSTQDLAQRFANQAQQNNPAVHRRGPLIDQLRAFLQDPRAKFTSSEQCTAIEACMNGEPSVIYINGTGSGKSMIFMLSAFAAPARCHVVLVPLVALKKDLLDRARRAGVNAASWEDSTHHNESLLVASYESMKNDEFVNWVKKKRSSGSIARIYVDEAHVIITQSNFRYIMRYISALNSLKVPLIYLTATFTEEIRHLFYQQMKISADSQLIRGLTMRKNIHYSVREVDGDRQEKINNFAACIHSTIDGLKTSNQLQHSDKIIIYMATIRDGERLAQALECDHYHASLPNRDEVWEAFTAADGSDHSLLVATSALGLGLDISNIRMVIHCGLQHSLVDFAQESGRAGRDGGESYSLLIHCEYTFSQWQARQTVQYNIDSMDFEIFQQINRTNMHKYVFEKQCRRAILNRVFDGIESSECDVEADMAACDLCARRMGIIDSLARRESQQRTSELEARMAFTNKLDGLKKMCGIYLIKSDWEGIYIYKIGECDRHQETRRRILKDTNRLKKLIRDEQLIREGYIYYEYYLSTMIY